MFCSVDLDQTRKTSPRLSAALSAIINEACTIWKALFWGLRFTSWGIYQLEISEHRSNSFSHECSLRGLRNSMKKCWSMVMNDACFNEQRLANERICSNDKFAFMSSTICHQMNANYPFYCNRFVLLLISCTNFYTQNFPCVRVKDMKKVGAISRLASFHTVYQ